MPGKFCVSLTCAKDDPDRATVAFVVANAAVGSEQETVVFLSTEGVRLAIEGYADDVAEPGFSPLRDLMANFAAAGGTIYVCSPCFKRRSLDDSRLVAGAKIVGGAKLVEFLAGGAVHYLLRPRDEFAQRGLRPGNLFSDVGWVILIHHG